MIVSFIFAFLLVGFVKMWSSLAEYSKIFEQYTKSKTLLRENPDDFKRREAFLADARAYYNVKSPGAANEMKNEMIISNELNALTTSQVHKVVGAEPMTNASNNYHIARSEEENNSIDRIERKILNVCAAKDSGASIVEIITETRVPRIKILPVLEQLQKDQLIVVDNNNDGTVVYKLY